MTTPSRMSLFPDVIHERYGRDLKEYVTQIENVLQDDDAFDVVYALSQLDDTMREIQADIEDLAIPRERAVYELEWIPVFYAVGDGAPFADDYAPFVIVRTEDVLGIFRLMLWNLGKDDSCIDVITAKAKSAFGRDFPPYVEVCEKEYEDIYGDEEAFDELSIDDETLWRDTIGKVLYRPDKRIEGNFSPFLSESRRLHRYDDERQEYVEF